MNIQNDAKLVGSNVMLDSQLMANKVPYQQYQINPQN